MNILYYLVNKSCLFLLFNMQIVVLFKKSFCNYFKPEECHLYKRLICNIFSCLKIFAVYFFRC